MEWMFWREWETAHTIKQTHAQTRGPKLSTHPEPTATNRFTHFPCAFRLLLMTGRPVIKQQHTRTYTQNHTKRFPYIPRPQYWLRSLWLPNLKQRAYFVHNWIFHNTHKTIFKCRRHAGAVFFCHPLRSTFRSFFIFNPLVFPFCIPRSSTFLFLNSIICSLICWCLFDNNYSHPKTHPLPPDFYFPRNKIIEFQRSYRCRAIRVWNCAFELISHSNGFTPVPVSASPPRSSAPALCDCARLWEIAFWFEVDW